MVLFENRCVRSKTWCDDDDDDGQASDDVERVCRRRAMRRRQRRIALLQVPRSIRHRFDSIRLIDAISFLSVRSFVLVGGRNETQRSIAARVGTTDSLGLESMIEVPPFIDFVWIR